MGSVICNKLCRGEGSKMDSVVFTDGVVPLGSDI